MVWGELTLAEFDAMARGHHRREVEKYRRLRLVLAEVRNGLRGPGEDWKPASELLPLPGDTHTPTGPQLTDEEYAASLARLDELDKDLF